MAPIQVFPISDHNHGLLFQKFDEMGSDTTATDDTATTKDSVGEIKEAGDPKGLVDTTHVPADPRPRPFLLRVDRRPAFSN